MTRPGGGLEPERHKTESLQPASGGRRSALFLSPEAPYPLMGGGALRSSSLLHFLARGYDVDVVLFRQPGDADPAAAIPSGLVRRALVIDLPANGRGAASKAWRNASRLARRTPPLLDRFSGFGPVLSSYLQDRDYDIAVIEHFWCAPYVEQVRHHARRLILDLHNVESELHARCAGAETGPVAAAHRVFHRACRELERRWLPHFSSVLATSVSDARLVGTIAPGVPVSVYPNAIPAAPQPLRREEDVVVFPGNLEYHPNVTAVRYFRTEMWPLLRERHPTLVWRLVGRNPAAVRRYTEGDPRIEVTGPVPDAIAELARARVVVVPLLAGSGTRFKILEAWAAGAPIVSTTIGAEGLPVVDGVHLVLADTAPQFAAAVSGLLASQERRSGLAHAGRSLLEQQFTWETAWKLLDF